MHLSLREAARFLGLDESTLLRWAKRGELRAQRDEDHWRFDRMDLLAYAAEHGIAVSPEAVAEHTAAAGDERPTLRAALLAGGVHHEVPGADKASALRAVVERL